MTLDAALGVVIQPTPPQYSDKRAKKQLDTHSTPGKRFSVRDGFHLHDRNQELRETIDRRLFPPPAVEPPVELRKAEQHPIAGPNAEHIRGHFPQSRFADSLADAADGSFSQAAHPTKRVERIAAILDMISIVADDKPQVHSRASSHCNNRDVVTGTERGSEGANIHTSEATMRPSAEWLIYRHRSNAAPRWQEVKMEKLLRDTLQTDELSHRNESSSHAAIIGATAISLPRPRHQSTLGSTYAERVAAASLQRRHDGGNNAINHPDLSGRAIVGASTSEMERHLVHSREANNKVVDRLLLTLVQSPASTVPGSAAPVHPSLPLPTTRFATRRSEFREQTAAALKSRKLRSRVDELRSLPELIAKIESIQRLKHQQLVYEHGEDLVMKNRCQVRLSVLQRPPETPLFPSAVDLKLQLATKRKKELDAAQEAAVRNAVSRWQKRRQQQQELQAKRFRESQWLLIVMLAQSSVKWLKAFHLFKKKRDAINKVLMAKRIQHCWRQNALVRQNSLALLSFTPQTPLTSPFYRMSVVMKAIRLVQRFIRRWLESKRLIARRYAAAIIVTSWFEFQDVKFRRLILRFRKRVRDFQIMWREWRAITDARVKLLLLVWVKLEKKTKRRHGLATPQGDGSQGSTLSPRQSPPSPEGPRGLTLVEYFRLANDRNSAGGNAQIASPREPKRLEDAHRHLRNCGTVQAPIDVVAAAGSGNNSAGIGAGASLSPTLSVSTSAMVASQSTSPAKPETSPPPAVKVVKRNMKLVQNMGEEFQLAMYDYYTTTKAPKATSGSLAHASSTPRKAPVELGEAPKQPKSPKQQPQPRPSTRGKQKPAPSPDKPAPLAAILASVGGGPRQNEKVSLQLKMAVCRQLLSDKRRHFRETREQKRQEWTADRQHKRRVEFRYNVLDELAAFQRFQAENKVFLLLHSVSEADMMRAIRQAQQMANDAARPPPTAKVPETPRRSSQQAPFRGRRSSSTISLGTRRPSSSLAGPDVASITTTGKSHSIIAVGGARLERFDDDDDDPASVYHSREQ